jgi:hypothetical protein
MIMSKTGNWVFSMQEDAYYMTLSEFNKAYGEEAEGLAEVMEMDDGA